MVSRTDYLLNEVEHFAPYSQFDQSAPREDRVSEQIDIIMKEQQAMGFDRAAIASKSFDIEEKANRRVDEHTVQQDLVEELKLGKDSRILIISTEGDTDPEHYRKIVWDGLYPSY